MLRQLDRALQRMFALPYLFASCDVDLRNRCRYLMHQLETLDGEQLSVLDVGCGSGMTLRHLATLKPGRIGRYVGIDCQAEHLQTRSRKIRGIKVAFHNVDLNEDWDVGAFDVVWCSEVIERLIDDAGHMQKLGQAARPGGLVIITTPCLSFRRLIGDHVATASKPATSQHSDAARPGSLADDLERLAGHAGLIVERIDGVNRLTPNEFKERRKTQGTARIVNNIKQNWRAQNRQVFASGEILRAEPGRYASVGAILTRPVDPILVRPRPKTITTALPQRHQVPLS